MFPLSSLSIHALTSAVAVLFLALVFFLLGSFFTVGLGPALFAALTVLWLASVALVLVVASVVEVDDCFCGFFFFFLSFLALGKLGLAYTHPKLIFTPIYLLLRRTQDICRAYHHLLNPMNMLICKSQKQHKPPLLPLFPFTACFLFFYDDKGSKSLQMVRRGRKRRKKREKVERT